MLSKGVCVKKVIWWFPKKKKNVFTFFYSVQIRIGYNNLIVKNKDLENIRTNFRSKQRHNEI